MVALDQDLENKVKAAGICPTDLMQALVLARQLRIDGLKAGIGSKAMRVAILFTELSDRHFAEQHINPNEESQLQQLAKDLFLLAKKDYKGRG